MKNLQFIQDILFLFLGMISKELNLNLIPLRWGKTS